MPEEDISMVQASETASDAGSETGGQIIDALVPEKIIVLPGAAADGSAATFQIKFEDHTLGNALRYMIMKNPSVEFCGYTIPHPSEAKLNIRVQTYDETTAIEALHQGLRDLVAACDHIEDVFRERVSAGGYSA